MQKEDRISNIEKALKSAIIKNEEDEKNKAQKIFVELATSQFEKSKNYANFVIFGGYAAIFSIWLHIDGYLTQETNITVGILIGISIFVFVSYEITRMLFSARSIFRYRNLIDYSKPAREFLKSVTEFEDRMRRAELHLLYIWFLAFAICILTSFGAAAILFWNMLARLGDWPAWPE